MRFNFAFGSSVDLIKLGLLAIILAWGYAESSARLHKGKRTAKATRSFTKTAIEEAAEEDQAEKQAEQLKLVMIFAAGLSVKEANHSIGEALEDWSKTIDDARDDARDDYDDASEMPKRPMKTITMRTKAEKCRIAQARWCSEIDKDIIVLRKPSSTIKRVA